MPAPVPLPSPDDIRHSALDDAQGLCIGVLLCAVGLTFLSHLGLVTGQTAGLALVISYATGWSFGLVFFVVNLPFYWLAYRKLGLEFTLKSLACVTALSLATEAMPLGFTIEKITPVLGAVIFGATTGLGLLAIFRHRGSLGGLGVVALLVQDRTGVRAGYVQLLFDLVLFAVAAFLFPLSIIAYSLVGAAVVNGVIAFNHNRKRYIAT
ncbi:conserved hypothetical protein [Dinoroseobacter shibae DFL 12 = DSM 16493]|jgi:uncharacterized membrane-anchored protein YitT (DUF2179 family)|uniref:YitT family protein n=1 Tax=Dinoroseobacter shibae (strain DSM 16493 / NCIMB 14021 / DFL 12) TaxID=398580 RepID=A8LL15_DINSH|nr:MULTISPECIES: YitT family protein [Dinoroseobacter]ABV93379.1 conserved hypothetical protein [Dinoroseobacter shibae DFL 12 = DSM 16493]MDD9715526.1 YitT family protein [Dinoroseobacter sp. PD6]URF48294.1 YitT family protein [Dinoroseobacter shibae]URF52604.1 YitT family protein [Dinoroseobacter shibae]